MNMVGMDPTESEGHNGNVKEKGNYMTWTIEMDRVLTDILLEQFQRGKKTTLGWKPGVFRNVISMIKQKCDVSVTKENIRARLKTWEKHYKIVSELLKQDGFRWDDERKMIEVGNDIWNNYIKSHPSAKPYRWKVILNFKELAIIIGNNYTKGDCIKIGDKLDKDMEANEGLEDIGERGEVYGDEVNGADKVGARHERERSCASSAAKQPLLKKKRSRDAFASALITMVDAMKSMADVYTRRNEPTVDVEKLCKEITKIPDLDQSLILQAIDMLVADKIKEHVFHGLPEEFKKPWLLMHLGQSK